MRREQRGEGASFGRFDPDRVNAGRLGVFAHPIEKDRLADATQSDHQDAFSRAPQSQALTSHPDDLAQLVPSSELRRRSARAGGERIANGVHGSRL